MPVGAQGHDLKLKHLNGAMRDRLTDGLSDSDNFNFNNVRTCFEVI